MRRLATLAAVAVACLAMTVVVTWPQAAHMSTKAVSHHDIYFSIWRVAWVSHALVSSPLQLFNANIFHPATTSLAFSDAMLLEGIVGSPLLWLGVSPVLVYNLLFFVGIAGSGMAMFVLARYLTGETAPALIAAAVFTMAPYRVEHAMHLELQWTMWTPLTFWAIHRAVDEQSRRFGILAGVFGWLQVISCVYYGVFLALSLLVFIPMTVVPAGGRGLRALRNLMIGGVIAAVLTLPYAWAYYEASRNVGMRDPLEVARYSAKAISYAASPETSRLWGWTAERWGSGELRLYPGLIALALVVVSVVHRAKRPVLTYVAVTALAVAMSFGLNGPLFRWLSDQIPALLGFRALARFAMITMCGVAVLAGLGTQVLLERIANRRALIVTILLGLIAIDYAQRPLTLMPDDVTAVAPVYRVIRSAAPGVVADVPMPTPDRLPGYDALYAVWSISHWRPILGGYSGYYPRDYLRTLDVMRAFPDDASIARLRERQVKYIVVHRSLMKPEEYTAVMLRLAVRPDVQYWGPYPDPFGPAELFSLR